MFEIRLFFLCFLVLFVILTLLTRENMSLSLSFSAFNALISSVILPYEWVAVGVFVVSLDGLALTQIITEIILKCTSNKRKRGA